MNLYNEMKYRFLYASPVLKLILVNSAVFILSVLFTLFLWLFKGNRDVLESILALPSDGALFLRKPWTIITYQFTHFGIFHVFFNMIVLNMAGNIFMDFFKKSEVWKVYILGGTLAGLIFALSANYIPALKGGGVHVLIGASASVMALVFAAATYAPNIKLHLFGAIEIKLIWFALFFLLIDLVSIPQSNAGGHISHLGGALFGWLYAYYKKGKIQFKLFEPVIKTNYGGKPLKVEINEQNKHQSGKNVKSRDERTVNRAPTQEEVDAILDKISKSGYDRLSKEEKDILFKASQE